MGRAKLQLKFIQDQSRRLAAYRNRKRGLKKKARELAILCDVPVLVISFGPEGQVDIWPEDNQAIGYIIENYSQLGADIRNKHQLDILGYMKAEISKHQASFNRRLKDLAGTPSLSLDDMLDGTQETLGELICKVDSKLGTIRERIQVLKQHFSEGETMWKECNVEGQHLGELTPHDAMVGIQNGKWAECDMESQHLGELMPHDAMVGIQNREWTECNMGGQHLGELMPRDAMVGIQNGKWTECNMEGQHLGELMAHNGIVGTQNTGFVYGLMVSDPYLTMNTSLQHPTLPMDQFNSGEISSNAFLQCPNYVPMDMGEESSALVPSIPTSYASPFAGPISEYGSANSDVLPVPPLWSSIGLPENHNLMVGGGATEQKYHTNIIEVAQNNMHHSDIGLAQNWMVSPMPTYVSSEPWPFASNPPINHGHLLQSNRSSDGSFFTNK